MYKKFLQILKSCWHCRGKMLLSFLRDARWLLFCIAMRKCRNWQTSKTKDLVVAIPCGFKSHLPHYFFTLKSSGIGCSWAFFICKNNDIRVRLFQAAFSLWIIYQGSVPALRHFQLSSILWPILHWNRFYYNCNYIIILIYSKSKCIKVVFGWINF